MDVALEGVQLKDLVFPSPTLTPPRTWHTYSHAPYVQYTL